MQRFGTPTPPQSRARAPTATSAPALPPLAFCVGIYHATRYDSGSYGRVIAETMFATYDSTPPPGYVEYGSPVSPMGQGGTPDAQFLVPAKLVLDWVPESSVVRVPLGECSPCGPYYLQPTDSGVTGGRLSGVDPGASYAIRIASVYDRFFWVEHRTAEGVTNGGSAVVISSADYDHTSAHGGVAGTSVLVKADTGSGMSYLIHPGETVQLDVSEDGSTRPLWVNVGEVDSSGYIAVDIATTVPAPNPPTPPTPPGLYTGCGSIPCCKVLHLDGDMYELVEGGNGACCSGECTYRGPSTFLYLQYFSAYGEYFTYQAGSYQVPS